MHLIHLVTKCTTPLTNTDSFQLPESLLLLCSNDNFRSKSKHLFLNQKMTFRFPSLLPGAIDPLWFTVDRPCDDENELEQLEKEHDLWVKRLGLNLKCGSLLYIIIGIITNGLMKSVPGDICHFNDRTFYLGYIVEIQWFI